MRKLFIQFYLLLIACFLVVLLLSGLVYKQLAEKSGDLALANLLKATLTLVEYKLDGVPQAAWPAVLKTLDRNVDFPLSLQRLDTLPLDRQALQSLQGGDIVMIEEDDLFLLRVQDSPFALQAGPMGYLMFLHELKWLDYALLALIGLSLAIPVLLWMRPHWNELLQLENGAKRLSEGDFSARVVLAEHSGLQPLASGFNHMAGNVERLLDSKQVLINAVAHELRTPLARLRYRLALLEIDTGSPAHAGIERDLDCIGSLVDELLLHARLSRPDLPLQLRAIDAAPWLQQRLADLAEHHPALQFQLQLRQGALYADDALLARAVDNLLQNAVRYARHQVVVRLSCHDDWQQLQIRDDGPGIPAAERERVLEPFVRLDDGHPAAQGRHGLGLAIVQQIMLAHHGRVEIGDSATGGASLTLRWPAPPLQTVTRPNICQQTPPPASPSMPAVVASCDVCSPLPSKVFIMKKLTLIAAGLAFAVAASAGFAADAKKPVASAAAAAAPAKKAEKKVEKKADKKVVKAEKKAASAAK